MLGLPTHASVLITGATGFLGRHCLERLAKEGATVHAVNREGRGPAYSGVTWHAADLRDPAAARELVSRVRPTYLLHAAWIATPGRFWTDPENIDWLEGGLALLRGFGETGGARFVGVGTCAEYDWSQETYVEDETPIHPLTLYGKAKAAMGSAAIAYAARYGFSAAWGRVFLPYGPGDAPQRLIPMVIDSLLAGRTVELGPGTQERDFIYAPDVADLLVQLLASPENGAFNIGTGRGTRIRDVAERIADRLGGRALLRFGTVSRSGEPDRLVADVAKTLKRIGWSAPSRLEDQLEKLLDRAINAGVARASR